MPKQISTTILLPAEDRAALERIAAEEERTLAYIIRQAIKEYLARKEKRDE